MNRAKSCRILDWFNLQVTTVKIATRITFMNYSCNRRNPNQTTLLDSGTARSTARMFRNSIRRIHLCGPTNTGRSPDCFQTNGLVIELMDYLHLSINFDSTKSDTNRLVDFRGYQPDTSENGKPIVRWGRKVMGLKLRLPDYRTVLITE